MLQALEAQQIALLEKIRKASGKQPFERKPTKFKKVVSAVPPTQSLVRNPAIKRAFVNPPDETPKRKTARKELKDEDVPDEIENVAAKEIVVKDVGEMQEVQVKRDNDTKPQVKPVPDAVKTETKKKEKPISLSGEGKNKNDTKPQVKPVPAAVKTETKKKEKPISLSGEEKNKRRARTKNNKWCVFGCSALIYDFERGVALPEDVIEENMTKMRKSSREWSHESWLEKASLFHGIDSDIEELCVANALLTLKFNDLVNKRSNGIEKQSKYTTTVVFDLNLAKRVDTVIVLPSAVRLKMTDLFDSEFLRQLLHADVDKITRKMTLKVLDWISKEDRYCPAYTAPVSKPTAYVSLGSEIQDRIAKLIGVGLKWEEEKIEMEEGRIVMISRGIMENFLSKNRCRFNARTHPGAALLLARDLRGEFEGNEIGGSMDEMDEESMEHAEERGEPPFIEDAETNETVNDDDDDDDE